MKNWIVNEEEHVEQTYVQDKIDEGRIRINPSLQKNKRAFVIDNFYEDPYAVREFALQQEFFDDPGYIGRRTRTQHLFPGLKETFESIIGEKISEWETYGIQRCIVTKRLKYITTLRLIGIPVKV